MSSLLSDFFQLNEKRDVRYTIEPDGDGARLKSWETLEYPVADDDVTENEKSYEVIAGGDFDEIINRLTSELNLGDDEIDSISQMFQMATDSGGSVSITNKGGKTDIDYMDTQDSKPDIDDEFGEVDPERYF